MRRFVPGKVSLRLCYLVVCCTTAIKPVVSDGTTADSLSPSSQDTEALSLSLTLQQSLLPSLILDALPKSQIDLFVTILESDGSDSDISA